LIQHGLIEKEENKEWLRHKGDVINLLKKFKGDAKTGGQTQAGTQANTGTGSKVISYTSFCIFKMKKIGKI
jgi:hypothetical protein